MREQWQQITKSRMTGIFTTRKQSLRRLCFTGVCLSTGGCLPQCMLGYTPPQDQRQTPPGNRGRHQTPLPWADTLPEQTPSGRYPLGRHPRAQCMLGDTVNKRSVCIPLECIFVLDLSMQWQNRINEKRLFLLNR